MIATCDPEKTDQRIYFFQDNASLSPATLPDPLKLLLPQSAKDQAKAPAPLVLPLASSAQTLLANRGV